jgi:diguanylate cyclase (GGDEF)-like protein/PAS domain S-box-containing protein
VEVYTSGTRAVGLASRLRALGGIAAAMDVNGSDAQLLRGIVEEVRAALGDHCSIALTSDAASGEPRVSSHTDGVRAELEAFLVANQEAEAVVSAGDPGGGWLARNGLRQSATFPILGNDRRLGVMAITRAADRPAFDEEELAFGAAVAAFLGVAVIGRRMLAHTTATVEELRAQAEVFEQISDALITCDEEHRVLSWNAAAEKVYGYSQSEAIGCDLFALLDSQCFGADGQPLEVGDVLATVGESGLWDGELHERHASGAPLVVMASISAAGDGAGRQGGLVLVSRDVTTQRREEHLATHDALTGLPNRRMLNDRLYEAFARGCRTGWTVAVLFIDLDGFKPINDRYGHAAGDEVLTLTAQRLVNAVRRTDTVGRLGGDEFLVILEDSGTDENISKVANRIVDSVSAPMPIGDLIVSVRPSVGVAAVHHPDSETHRPDHLLAAADQAMYLAKALGGDPVFANMNA